MRNSSAPEGAVDHSPRREPWDSVCRKTQSPVRGGRIRLPVIETFLPPLTGLSTNACHPFPTAHAVGYHLPPLAGLFQKPRQAARNYCHAPRLDKTACIATSPRTVLTMSDHRAPIFEAHGPLNDWRLVDSRNAAGGHNQNGSNHFGFRISECGFFVKQRFRKIRNPQSAIRNSVTINLSSIW